MHRGFCKGTGEFYDSRTSCLDYFAFVVYLGIPIAVRLHTLATGYTERIVMLLVLYIFDSFW